MPRLPQDMIGQRFGRLKVVAYAGKSYDHLWECECDCGNTKVIAGYNMRAGNTSSCGCYRNEQASKANSTHQLRDKYPLTYTSWKSLRKRCNSKNATGFHLWGGRGITYADRWDSFPNFLADMGPRPSKEYSIDRVDNNLGYTPENCRWATRKQQCRNTRRNHLVTFDGKTKTLAEWAETLGFAYATLRDRLGKYGWSIHDALTTPVKP